jgi:hypothetical protein
MVKLNFHASWNLKYCRKLGCKDPEAHTRPGGGGETDLRILDLKIVASTSLGPTSIERNFKLPLSGFKLCPLDVLRVFASALTTIPDWTFIKIRNKYFF